MRKSYLYIAYLFMIYLLYFYAVWSYFFVFTESVNAYHQMAEWLPLATNVHFYQITMINLLLALMAGITLVMYINRSPHKNKGFLKFLLGVDILFIILGVWQVLERSV